MIVRRLKRSATTPDNGQKKTRYEARDKHQANVASGASQIQNDRVECDRVEPIAHLTNYLSQPKLTEVAVPAQQVDVADWFR